MEAMRDSLLKRTAPGNIRRRMEQIAGEYQVWSYYLGISTLKDKKKARQELTFSQARIKSFAAKLKPTFDDLAALRNLLFGIADAISGEPIQQSELIKGVPALIRMGQPERLRIHRFKPEFEEAFRLRHEAKKRGQVITAKALAQRLTEYGYQKNPDSAIRNMEQGINRVDKEHRRLKRLRVPSPFL